jgi:hypothetical protein
MHYKSFSRIVRTTIVSLALVVVAGVASAQDFELEGKINDINVAARTVTVMGTVVSIPSTMNVDTPTGSLPLSAFDPAAGPDLRNVATGIILGTRDAAGVNVAASIFIEIAENVMFGGSNSVSGTEIVINGTGRIRINAPGSGVGDSRFAAVVHPSANFSVFADTGYPVALPSASTTLCVLSDPANPLSPLRPLDSTKACAIEAGELISAEGDYRVGADGVAYLAAHTLEAGKLVLYNPATVPGNKDYIKADPTAVRDGNRIELRGFGTFAGGRVNLYRSTAACVQGTGLTNNNGVLIGATMSTVDGRFRFDKVAFSGSTAFTHLIVRTTNGASVCVPVELDD